MRLLTSRSGVRASQGASYVGGVFADPAVTAGPPAAGPRMLLACSQASALQRRLPSSPKAAVCRWCCRCAGCARRCRRFLSPAHDLRSSSKDAPYRVRSSLCNKSFLSSAGQSARLLTSRSGARASQGASYTGCVPRRFPPPPRPPQPHSPACLLLRACAQAPALQRQHPGSPRAVLRRRSCRCAGDSGDGGCT